MRCKPGDLAYLARPKIAANLGILVQVLKADRRPAHWLVRLLSGERKGQRRHRSPGGGRRGFGLAADRAAGKDAPREDVPTCPRGSYRVTHEPS